MDFSLRSVRRPTVLSIPTAPFSFSTPLSSSVRSVDSTLRAYRGSTVSGFAAPVFFLFSGLPVGAYADLFLVALLLLSLLFVSCLFLSIFTLLFSATFDSHFL